MKIEINPRLKPLYANLLRQGIGKYLISTEFNHFCIENNLDQQWDASYKYARSLSGYTVLFPGYTGYAEDALGVFLGELGAEKNTFIEILGKILINFAAWSSENIDFSKIKKDIIDLGYSEDEIERIFSQISNKKWKKSSIQFKFLEIIKSFREERNEKASSKKDGDYINLFKEKIAQNKILAIIIILCLGIIGIGQVLEASDHILDFFNINELKQTSDYQIAFLPGNFEIDLSKDYSPITMVEIKVEANNGEITLLRESELLEQKIDGYPFDELVFHMSNIEILSLEPKDAIIGENKNSSIIIIKFDSSKLLPLGNYSSNFRKGDIVKFGDLKVRLFYRSNNDVVFEDIIIPMYLTKE